jgi:F-type H+-transporting ATPase subunit epsilon
MPLKLEIVTPDARVFSDEVDSVVLPGFDGEMGVLPAHAPLVTTLLPGELRYTKSGKTVDFAVGEGLLEVTQTAVRVLTELAVEESAIDEAKVQAALDRAQNALKDAANLSPDEIAATEATISRSLAQLKLKRKRKTI